MATTMPKPEKFRFRKLDTIGAAAAEQDAAFLDKCFVDTGDLRQLRDLASPRRIVVGRTGSGKTALLMRLTESDGRSIEVKPESLALAYVSNSTVLRFFSDLGVKLDIFFRLLWRHVFTVEILKHHFHIFDEAAKKSFVDKFLDLFRDQRHRKAIEYIQKWGQSFWQGTEYRIQELTTTLEDNLKAAVKPKFPGLNFGTESMSRLSQEQKAELIQRAQHVVNEVQIRELSEVMVLLDDVLTDEQKRYFILIDRLDEDWIEEQLRMRLIRALIETVKDFTRVKHAKIVVAIRLDLLERVFRLTRDAGFQEEKYESLYLPLEWTRPQLTEILETRINWLIRSRYSQAFVKYSDILPRHMDGQPALEYMLARTAMRPRDLIQFFNFWIAKAVARPVLTAQIIREAEGEYSRHRLRSLADEWYADYPNIMEFMRILEAKPRRFKLRQVSDNECAEFALDALSKSELPKDDLQRGANQLINLEVDEAEFRRIVFYTFYRVGVVGLRAEHCETLRGPLPGDAPFPAQRYL